MLIFGYKDNQIIPPKNPSAMREVSFKCTYDELIRITNFISNIAQKLEKYEFPYGDVAIQFRDEDSQWKQGDPDIVIVVTGQDRGQGDGSVVP